MPRIVAFILLLTIPTQALAQPFVPRPSPPASTIVSPPAVTIANGQVSKDLVSEASAPGKKPKTDLLQAVDAAIRPASDQQSAKALEQMGKRASTEPQ